MARSTDGAWSPFLGIEFEPVGAGGRVRTVDLPLTRRLLCQLSYAGPATVYRRRGELSSAMPGYTGGMASRSRTPRVTRRSILALCLLMLALAVAVAAVTACSPDQVTAASPSAVTQAAQPQAARAAPAVKARSGIVVGRRSGKVLWSKDAGLRLAPASCTKIMTALLVLEHYRDLTRMVRAPASVTQYQQVAIGLRPGDRISVRQALRATMTKSANDACVTLATAVGGSETRFVTLMNRRARQLGLTHTHFVNSRGRRSRVTTPRARDLARLGRYAMRDAEFRDLVGTKTRVITWPPSHSVTVTSHNRLLDYAWGDGIKTGATAQSKMVLVGSGTPGALKVPLMVVTMREPTRERGGEGRGRAVHVGRRPVRDMGSSCKRASRSRS